MGGEAGLDQFGHLPRVPDIGLPHLDVAAFSGNHLGGLPGRLDIEVAPVHRRSQPGQDRRGGLAVSPPVAERATPGHQRYLSIEAKHSNSLDDA
ncbi:hypothetical protein G6F46_015429 [Rhizopus delemar]|uniref:Uncharacterized protein n=1 Tax=Rhizopus delemar TaxID=936053 RepID=A0A9P7BYG7_9FUNG|nr:hypothetical protein G6F50_018367 [Rhizopus delemar]KAG1581008.1 hypothetical protein G6F46_015429 [Rhizopus delemar]